MLSSNKYYNILAKKINNKTAVVSIIGLGYVGQPLMKLIVSKNYTAIGVDSNDSLVKTLKKKRKRNITITTSYKDLKKSDIIIFALPTPIKKFLPDLSYIEKSLLQLSPYLKKNSLLILESTSYPGCTREIFIDFIKKNNFIVGKEIFLGYSPERVDPGNKKFNINNTPKICSGYSNNCLKLTYSFYESICKKVIKASSLENAEMAKLFENIFRLVNIGLVNELKQISTKFKIDINEVLDLASTKPFGFMKFSPGPGVGGHCIPVDPFYFSWKAKQKKITTKFVNLAARVNAKMPLYIYNNIIKIIKNKLSTSKKLKLLFLGASYKKNIEDLRNSPALEVFKLLMKNKIKFDFNDNYVKRIKVNTKFLNSKKINSIQAINKYDFIILLTDHDYFKIFDTKKIQTDIIDTRNFFKKKKVFKI